MSCHQLSHIALYIPLDVDTKKLAEDILNGRLTFLENYKPTLRGGLLSHKTIRDIVNRERLHDYRTLKHFSDQPLYTMSNGEQRHIVLNYLLKQDLDYLILDNPFDYLDKIAQQDLLNKIEELRYSIPIIQLFSRVVDVFNFINDIWYLDDGRWTFILKIDFLKRRIPDSHTKQVLPIQNTDYQLNEILVRFEDFNLAYDQRPILSNINWTIRKNEFWQLSGTNGSGKSSLLSIIVGDNPKGYGENIHLCGHQKGSGETVWDIKKHIGYFSADVPERLTRYQVAIDLLMGGFFDSIGLYENPSELQRETAKNWLVYLGISTKEQAYYGDLTLAEQRLLMIARAMIKSPKLLLLDEPTASLDDSNAAIVMKILREIYDNNNTSIVLVSHRDEEIDIPLRYHLETSSSGSTGSIL